MTIHVHVLRGCAPAPLAHYLKALGVLRLVCEQKDPRARGFWKDDAFHLVTILDAAALHRFVCDEFEPTPFIAPWNGASGFYPKDSHEGIDAIVGSTAPRFGSYREAILRARVQVAGRSQRPAGDEKSTMLADCSRSWPEPAFKWFSVVAGLGNDGTGRYPALLGTGGNVGHLDYTNNAMQRYCELIDLATGTAYHHSRDLARSALFGGTELGLTDAAVGQFLPGAAGGANATAGFEGQRQLNPWDFLLMLEGTIAFRVAALRRLDGRELAQAAAPFAVRGLAVGYASTAEGDDDGRGEQWLPLWRGPSTFDELSRVFAEARILTGGRRGEDALDVARATAQFGVARGIDTFVRFGFVKRHGQNELAIPLTRVAVVPSPSVRLLDQLDQWLQSLRWAAQDKHAPASFGRALRGIQRAMFDVSTHHRGPRAWCEILEQLGATEDLMVRSGRFTADRGLRPLPRLTSGWLDVAEDESVEFRLACALASVRAPVGAKDEDPIRAHCLPLDPASRYRKFTTSGDALRHDPRVVWAGHDLVSDLGAIVIRRTIEATERGGGLPMCSATFARLDDIGLFVSGEVNDGRIAALARGLMSVMPRPSDQPSERPLALYALFRATSLDSSDATRRQLPTGVSPRADVQTMRLLAAGRLADAGRIAVARLTAMGFRPKLRAIAADPAVARRLLASLAFPISPTSVRRVLDTVARPIESTASENS